jgi:hypothetical protein
MTRRIEIYPNSQLQHRQAPQVSTYNFSVVRSRAFSKYNIYEPMGIKDYKFSFALQTAVLLCFAVHTYHCDLTGKKHDADAGIIEA